MGEKIFPKRLVPLIVFSTWLSHLFGASVGREGVAVQIGGVIGHAIGKKLSAKEAKKILLITGMAAGFAGLFQTPIAATFFAIEILMLGKIEYRALIPALVGSYVASWTSSSLGLEKFSFAINTKHSFLVFVCHHRSDVWLVGDFLQISLFMKAQLQRLLILTKKFF
ncbi:Chloride/fluoride channel protein [Lactococcus lactis]|nr:Chloride/fluoride channel protein [Lactococcus lactis]